jgi:hypothetical protein
MRMAGDGYSPAGKPVKLLSTLTGKHAGNFMHELKRRAYLDAMGIATYVSRGQRSNAAPTTKLFVVRHVVARDGSLAEPARLAGPVATQMFDVDLPREAKQTPPVAGVAAGHESNAVEFSVIAFMTGRWLWLEELPPQQALMRDQVLLVQAMARALGWGSHKPEISQFNWPIHNNSQLDLGEEAARASLGSFVNRKLESESCRGLVLLGADCQRWVPQDQPGVGQRVLTVSTSDMLYNPQQKKQAWRDLLPYAGNP